MDLLVKQLNLALRLVKLEKHMKVKSEQRVRHPYMYTFSFTVGIYIETFGNGKNDSLFNVNWV